MKPILTGELEGALAEGQPMVALESTIIAHGMPYPQNFYMARDVERVIRKAGALPATIAVIGGELRVGLSEEELARFAEDGPSIMKVSTRDLPYVVSQKLDGATTVASTMRIAALTGIQVFATGGIGGVHRGAATSFDISNDLAEFTRSNVAVVTAGAKAILDLPATLEVLESNGVPVVGFGTDAFPAFYSRESGLTCPLRLDTAEDVAQLLRAKWRMGLAGGVVIANPIPVEAEIPAAMIAPAIARAVAEAELEGIAGKHVTPSLLKRLAEITDGRSLAANIALVMNNARVAADIAVALAK
jgi:pseudouridylate synthase